MLQFRAKNHSILNVDIILVKYTVHISNKYRIISIINFNRKNNPTASAEIIRSYDVWIVEQFLGQVISRVTT